MWRWWRSCPLSTTIPITGVILLYAISPESRVVVGLDERDVSFPSNCEIMCTTTKASDYTRNAYYVARQRKGNVVAHTAKTNTPLALISYETTIKPALEGTTVTLNDCPAKAGATTATGLGAIGYLVSGRRCSIPFEMDATTPAVADNGSYTFYGWHGHAADGLLYRPMQLAQQRNHLARARQPRLRDFAGGHQHRPIAHYRHRA